MIKFYKMNKKMTLLVAMFSLIVSNLVAQISITNSNPYTQDFNSLPNSGSPTTTNPNPVDWYRHAGTTNAINLTVGTGSSNSGGFYSVGATDSTDRALGSLLSSTPKPFYFGAKFVNNTGSTIVSAAVSYRCEQWRRGNSTNGLKDTLFVEYSTDADSVRLGTWTRVPSLTGSSVNTSTTTGALDGNAVFTNVAGNITGMAVPNGATFWIRFNDYDIPGSEDLLAVDDFSVSFTTGTVAACTEPTNSVSNLVLSATSTTAVTGSFNATVPASDGYLVLLDSNAVTPTITDATAYSNGDLVGTAVVVSNGANTTFNKSGLVQNTIYYAYVFPYNNAGCLGGPNYKTSAPANDSAKTLVDACPEPATNPTNITFTLVGDNSIEGQFNRTTPPADGYIVVQSLSSNIGYPADSTNYNVGDSIISGSFKSKVADVSSSANDTTFVITGLASGTKYNVAVIPYNLCGAFKNYRRTASNGVNRDDTTTTGTPPLTDCVQPSGVSNSSIVKLDSTTSTITIKWKNSSNGDSVMIVAAPSSVGSISIRDTMNYPVGTIIPSSNATSAKVYFRGTDSICVLTGLSQNTLYKIFVIAFNNKNCLNGPNYGGLATAFAKTALSTGVKYNNVEAEFNLFPNPTNTGAIYVKFKSPIKEVATLEVVDILGRKLIAQQLAPGNDMESIDVSSLSKGTYILNIVYKGSNNVSTFIVE